MKYTATIATNQPDQDGERFSDEALEQIAMAALFAPVTQDFTPPQIGSIVSSVLLDGSVSVSVEIEGDLPSNLYVVPAITFDPNDCTEEGGVKVYHRVSITSFALTSDPSDQHLTPLVRSDPDQH